MKLTERRAMLYLPQGLYSRSVAAARRKGRSLASLVREAIERYLAEPQEGDREKALRAGFGLWRGRGVPGIAYEDRVRAQWRKRNPS